MSFEIDGYYGYEGQHDIRPMTKCDFTQFKTKSIDVASSGVARTLQTTFIISRS